MIPLEYNPAEPWDAQPFDIEPAYSAFWDYLRRGPDRRLRDVARATGRRLATLERWRAEYGWDIRAAAYDKREMVVATAAELVSDAPSAPVEEQRDVLSKMLRLAKLAVDEHLADKGRGIPLCLSPTDIARLAETAIKLERLLGGLSTENVAAAVDLSGFTIAELRSWRELCLKAGMT